MAKVQAQKSHYVTLMNVSERLILKRDDPKVKKTLVPPDHVMVRFGYPGSSDGYAGAVVSNACLRPSTNRYCQNIMLYETERIPLVYKDAEHKQVVSEISPREFKQYFNDARKALQAKAKEQNTTLAEQRQANEPVFDWDKWLSGNTGDVMEF